MLKSRFLSKELSAIRSKKNEALVSVRFNKFIRIIESSISYTELELFGEFGGYVGLFLGLSILDLRQIVSKFLDCYLGK